MHLTMGMDVTAKLLHIAVHSDTAITVDAWVTQGLPYLFLVTECGCTVDMQAHLLQHTQLQLIASCLPASKTVQTESHSHLQIGTPHLGH